MSPTYAVVPHRLIPGVSGVSTDAQNLVIRNNNQGGFGSAEWDTFADPGLAKGDAVAIDLEDRAFEGKVASVTSGIGATLSYHVACVGRFKDHTYDETVEGVFVDRDMSQWQLTDCNNWSVAPDFQINVENAAGIRFSWPDVEKVTCWQSETGTAYDHVGNSLPRFAASDFPAAPKLWTAAYYRMQGAKAITGLSLEVFYYLMFGSMMTMTTPDYTNPIGPPDEVHGHRFSVYPKINYWTKFYGLSACLKNCYLGIYQCDTPADLPCEDPVAMYHDAHLLQKFEPSSSVPWSGDPLKLRFGGLDCRTIGLYAAYLPVRLPFNLAHAYSKNADHLVRTKWVARNRLYATCGSISPQWVHLQNISVYSQGYESQADGSDDLADVFTILFPTGSFEAMPLPAPDDDTAPTSIALRTPTTEAAAVPELLSLYPQQMQWGWWESDVLTIEHDAGAASISDEPGVDTTNAAASDDGAVDLVLVEFSPTQAPPSPGAFQMPITRHLTVDKDGTYAVVDEHWAPSAGQRVAWIDAREAAHDETAAARIGQALAIDRRPGQWGGSVVLTAIANASTIRPGKTLSGAGITDALITSTTVEVGADRVTLELGPTGYHGRFPARVPGKPGTAAPSLPMTPNGPMPGMRRRSGGR